MNACYALQPTSIKTLDGRFCRTQYQFSVRQGVQGYKGKFFVTLAVVVCQQDK